MHKIIRHPPEKLFVAGNDTVVMPLTFLPHTVIAKFIDAEPIRFPGCNPLFKDSVIAAIVKLPHNHKHNKHTYGIKIDWTVSSVREIEWLVTELTS